MYARSYPLDYVRHRSVKSQRNYTKTYHCLSSCNPVFDDPNEEAYQENQWPACHTNETKEPILALKKESMAKAEMILTKIIWKLIFHP
jgi:hypothetical protein